MSVHVIAATDGSRASLEAVRHLTSFADPAKVSDVTVVAVVSPLAVVPFVNDLDESGSSKDPASLSFRDEADAAVATVAGELERWGATVHRQVRSGSPAAEIVRAAEEVSAGLIVIASGSGGLTETVLLGSTAQRVQHSAPCPVLVTRPTR